MTDNDLGWDYYFYKDGERVGSPNGFERGYDSKEEAERSRDEWIRAHCRPGETVDLRVERIAGARSAGEGVDTPSRQP